MSLTRLEAATKGARQEQEVREGLKFGADYFPVVPPFLFNLPPEEFPESKV